MEPILSDTENVPGTHETDPTDLTDLTGTGFPPGSFDNLEATYRTGKAYGSETTRVGNIFERHVAGYYLMNSRQYRGVIKKVWPRVKWIAQHPDHIKVKNDKGIDLVAETYDGKFWAIQAKGYHKDTPIDKGDLDGFLSESNRDIFDYRLMITSSSNPLTDNLLDTIDGYKGGMGLVTRQDFDNPDEITWPDHIDHIHKTSPPKQHELFPDQKRAVDNIIDGFQDHDRGQVHRACGTGKTLVAAKVAERMNARLSLVLAPSLEMTRQNIEEWTTQLSRPVCFKTVCSDEAAGKDVAQGVRSRKKAANVDDEAINAANSLSHLGYPSETDPEKIADFIQKMLSRDAEDGIADDYIGCIFSTYQSLENIARAQAILRRRGIDPSFDVVFQDEAHVSATQSGSSFCLALEPVDPLYAGDNPPFIEKKKLLSLTATPQILSTAAAAQIESINQRRKEAEQETGKKQAQIVRYSMNNKEQYGPVFDEYTLREAIADERVCDYEIAVMCVREDDPDLLTALEENHFVKGSPEYIATAEWYAKLIGTARAIHAYNLTSTISFHASIAASKSFAKGLPAAARIVASNQAELLLPPEMLQTNLNALNVTHVDGKMATGILRATKDILNEASFDDPKHVSNCKLIATGYNARAINGIFLMDVPDSNLLIAQIAGRGLRTHEKSGKKKAVMVIGMLVKDSMDIEEAIAESDFNQAVNLLRAFKEIDGTLANEIEALTLRAVPKTIAIYSRA